MTAVNVGKRRSAAFGVVAGLALASAALVASQPASAATVTGGTVEWGVKDSFRTYIVGPIAQGSISVADGATQAAGNGVFAFPVSGGAHDAGATAVDAGGSVHFTGHAGQLDVVVSNISVSVTGTSGTLFADVTSLPLGGSTPTNYSNVGLAALDLTAATTTPGTGTVTVSNVAATMTAEGAPAFAGFYPEGTALDPVTLTLALDGGTVTPPPSAGARTVAGGSLRWVVSDWAWAGSSMTGCRQAVAPATFSQGAWNDPASGVVFPLTSGTYDTTTGASTLQAAGAFVFGNVSQGNYRLRLTDPSVEIDAAGNGVVSADVAYSLANSGAHQVPDPDNDACANATRVWVGQGRVVVARFASATGERSVTDDSAAWSIGLPWADASPPNSFAQELITATTTSPSNLANHFMYSSTPPTATDLRKAAAPIAVAFDLVPILDTATIDISAEVPEGDGTFAINVSDASVDLGSLELATNGQYLEASGGLGTVTVIDTRVATNPGWNVNAHLTDFEGPDDASIPANGLGWSPQVAHTGVPNITAGPAVAPGVGISGATLGSAAPGQGLGTSQLSAGLVLHAPTQTPSGDYTAVLTLTAI